MTHDICIVKTRTNKHFFMLMMVMAWITVIQLSVSIAKILDIELNPGPVNSYMLLQSRLAGGAGDCFFRAVSQQLYGEPTILDRIK